MTRPSPPSLNLPLSPQILDPTELTPLNRHIKRVIRYARPEDYVAGGGMAVGGPLAFWTMEKFQPTYLGRAAFMASMRTMFFISAAGGFFWFASRSTLRFYGWRENAREVEMDKREMVDRIKKGQKPYGDSTMSPYLQGVAARNSRHSTLFIHTIPWFNFVNHEYHGVDTAKYYRQAERELEAERVQKAESA
ncbi:MAG: hypothetical protein M1814_004442 [Vezdaea aestivalis]|nr:MAG: hypothetical protein M1814_004442 [Vezdaea aestivalis]